MMCRNFGFGLVSDLPPDTTRARRAKGGSVKTERSTVMRKVMLGVGVLLLAMTARPTLGASPKKEPLVGKSVGLLVSDTVTQFFLAHYPSCGDEYPAGSGLINSYVYGVHEYERYWMGWAYVLTQAQIPYVQIGDGDLNTDGLRPFGLLIIPNGVNLSKDAQSAIATWVKAGGNLIATYGTGYKDVTDDLHQDDLFKLQKGGTGGLHELWGDPLKKLFGSGQVDTNGVDIQIANPEGPTAGYAPGTVITYAWQGNMLIQRNETNKDVRAMMLVDNWTRPQPAILYETPVKGKVVYFAFAPEYIVSLRYDLAGHCLTPIVDDRYTGIVQNGTFYPWSYFDSSANYFDYLEKYWSLGTVPHNYHNWSDRLIELMNRTIQFMAPQ
jgi:Beta-galactosidase trimerisation domain